MGSGCAALIYQVVWFQLLQLIIGSSAVSLGVLLSTFMAGMCLGSFALPRYVDARRHPLRVYACLEIGIGFVGLVLLFGMPFVGGWYRLSGGGLTYRAVVASLCLMPPTLMMGATLPAVARSLHTWPTGISWIGVLYSANTVGAVFGTLVAGFYLLRLYDVAIATYVAAGLNVVVALVSLRLAERTPLPTPRGPAIAERTPPSPAIYLAIALSGFTALSSEVIWTRLLSLLLGATVYAFSLILAGFLSGLGVGSVGGAYLARISIRPRLAFGGCQILLAAAIAWAAYLLTERMPFAPVSVSMDPWTTFQTDLMRCLSVVLPAAILWGASFPLALAAAAAPDEDPGRVVGGVYAANTLGAIAGSLGIVVAIAYFGSQRAQQFVMAISTVSALVLLASLAGSVRVRKARWIAIGCLVAGAGIGGVLAWRVSPVPGILIAYGRTAGAWQGLKDVVYAGEGLNAFVAVSRSETGGPVYHSAGKVQASSDGEDLRLQRMLGHFSHLIPSRPNNVLVIGLGAGITAGAVSISPRVEHVTIVEIERLVPALVSKYFADYNYQIMDSPKVTVNVDDARHFVLTTNQKFDVITSDLVDPWVKGTAALFTQEFFEAAKNRLRPGGIVTMFVQLYMSNVEAVKSEIGTFVQVFPNTIIWGNAVEGQGYDLVVTGQAAPVEIDIDQVQARLDSPEYAQVAQSLREIGIVSAVELLSNYAGSASDLAPWLSDAVINRDRNMRLEYLAGMGMNVLQNAPIYAEMLQYTKFPEHVFAGSPASIRALRAGIEHAVGRPLSREGN